VTVVMIVVDVTSVVSEVLSVLGGSKGVVVTVLAVGGGTVAVASTVVTGGVGAVASVSVSLNTMLALEEAVGVGAMMVIVVAGLEEVVVTTETVAGLVSVT